MNIDAIVKEALESSASDFLDLTNKVNRIISDERESIGAHKLKEGLVILSENKRLATIGDLHGDLESLAYILRSVDLKENDVLFLGDYGDRGEESPEVYYVIFKLKEVFKDEIILLRGNHEGPTYLPVWPHDLPFMLEERYGENSSEIYEVLRATWDRMCHAAIAKRKYLFLHGGVSERIGSIEDLAGNKYLEEVLWNDPFDGRGTRTSPRGVGKLFGEDVTSRVLNNLGVKTLIRSHEPCDGVDIRHEGKTLTLFSRKGAPYFNNRAAWLNLDLSRSKSGYELLDDICYVK